VRETIQACISDLITSASWADQELKSYRQVDLDPWETRRVELEIPISDLRSLTRTKGVWSRRASSSCESAVRVGPRISSARRSPWNST
jgi:beta-glucosidase